MKRLVVLDRFFKQKDSLHFAHGLLHIHTNSGFLPKKHTTNKRANLNQQVLVGRILIVALALIGLVIAYNPPSTIFQIATGTFTGLAVLFPTTIAAIYWKGVHPLSCIISILIGEFMLIGFSFELIPQSLTFGFLPVVPILLICSLIIIIGNYLANHTTRFTSVD